MNTEDLYIMIGLGAAVIGTQYLQPKIADLAPANTAESQSQQPMQSPLYALVAMDKTGIYTSTKSNPSFPDGNGSGLITTLYEDNMAGKLTGKKENGMLEISTQIGGQHYKYFIHENAVRLLTLDEYQDYPVLAKTDLQLIAIRNKAL
ncbi:hypothetical protein [Persicobacter diffluens]|uniref:Uncharacterized protein n=1 Tax=Persicobacter diffluens TaxID=981 RepID=A0AAN5AQ56_9BACT|nr:hypothetical protein PEDI_55130 [Persicobacter diffluens]